MGQARGVVILACANSGLEIREYTPLQIKQGLVGYGRAEKKQIQAMVKTILNLSEAPKPDDTADALAAAICHGHCAGHLSKLEKYSSLMKTNAKKELCPNNAKLTSKGDWDVPLYQRQYHHEI